MEVNFNKHGLPILDIDSETSLSFEICGPNELLLKGNRQGLLLLAQALLGVAEIETFGYHHLDGIYGINKDGKSFIIQKQE